VIICRGGNRALVRADLPNRKVSVQVNGAVATHRELLGIVRFTLDQIHATNLRHVAAEPWVLLAGHPGIALLESHLLAAVAEGRKTFPVFVDGKYRDVSIQEELLSPVEPQPKPLRLFLSYRHLDDEHRQKLRARLKPLEREGLIHREIASPTPCSALAAI